MPRHRAPSASSRALTTITLTGAAVGLSAAAVSAPAMASTPSYAPQVGSTGWTTADSRDESEQDRERTARDGEQQRDRAKVDREEKRDRAERDSDENERNAKSDREEKRDRAERDSDKKERKAKNDREEKRNGLFSSKKKDKDDDR